MIELGQLGQNRSILNLVQIGFLYQAMISAIAFFSFPLVDPTFSLGGAQ